MKTTTAAASSCRCSAPAFDTVLLSLRQTWEQSFIQPKTKGEVYNFLNIKGRGEWYSPQPCSIWSLRQSSPASPSSLLQHSSLLGWRCPYKDIRSSRFAPHDNFLSLNRDRHKLICLTASPRLTRMTPDGALGNCYLPFIRGSPSPLDHGSLKHKAHI